MEITLVLTEDQEKDLLVQILSRRGVLSPEVTLNREVLRKPFRVFLPAQVPEAGNVDSKSAPPQDQPQPQSQSHKKHSGKGTRKKNKSTRITIRKSSRKPYPKNLVEIAVSDYLKDIAMGTDFRWREVQAYVCEVLGKQPSSVVGTLADALRYWIQNFKIVKTSVGIYRVIK